MVWQFDQIAGPYRGTTEGPAWDGSGLLFSILQPSWIMRFDPSNYETVLYRKDTNCANGLLFDADGTLFACEGGARRVVFYGRDGTTNVLVDEFDGKRLNIPNDLAMDNHGRLWFTDPFYEGAGGSWSEDRSHKDLNHDSVYRLNPEADGSWSITRVTFDTTRPNGILFSLEYDMLYVAQSDRDPDQKRELRAYPVNVDGSLGEYDVLYDFGRDRGVDGMVLTNEGYIVAAAGWNEGGPGPSLYVFSPTGEVVERHPVPVDRPTNCSFGGKDLSTLYVTTYGGHLFRTETDFIGRVNYPRDTEQDPEAI